MCVCFFSLFAQLCVLFNHWAMAHRMDDIQTGLKEERVQPKKSDTFFPSSLWRKTLPSWASLRTAKLMMRALVEECLLPMSGYGIKVGKEESVKSNEGCEKELTMLRT